MIKLREDTEEQKEFAQFIKDTSWSVRHTWPDWKIGETGRTYNRRPIKTVADLYEFFVKEGLRVPCIDNMYKFTVRGHTYVALRDGEDIQIYRPSTLYILED
jgi:hypothetical protein